MNVKLSVPQLSVPLVGGEDAAIRSVAAASAYAQAATGEVPMLDLEPESPEESDDERQRRKRTQATAIKLSSGPTVSGFRAWLSDFYQACCTSSNRSRSIIIRYIHKVEQSVEPSALLGVPKKWE